MMIGLLPRRLAILPWKVIFAITGLSLFGTIVLYSAAGASMRPWALPHLVQFGLFLMLALGVRMAGLDLLRRAALPSYGACLFLLLLVEIIGQVGGGSQRWLSLGPLTIQPSELMKLTIILAIARFYEMLPAAETANWKATALAGAIMAAPAALVLVQPDLDTALVLIVGGAVVMFLAGAPMRLFVLAGGAAAVLAPLAYFFVLQPYQQVRLLSFIDPESDPLGAGYHVIQSKIAIGSGGIFGKGFLNGTQGQLQYLPEHHTDLVFATLFEEWGLVIGLGLLALYLWLFHWGYRTARRSSSRFGKLLAAGVTTTVFFYVAMNMLTATGVTPVMGIPLPFISHGGSAMMTIMLAFGLIMAVERDELRRTDDREMLR
jgi:rod shape determining protein RodA